MAALSRCARVGSDGHIACTGHSSTSHFEDRSSSFPLRIPIEPGPARIAGPAMARQRREPGQRRAPSHQRIDAIAAFIRDGFGIAPDAKPPVAYSAATRCLIQAHSRASLRRPADQAVPMDTGNVTHVAASTRRSTSICARSWRHSSRAARETSRRGWTIVRHGRCAAVRRIPGGVFDDVVKTVRAAAPIVANVAGGVARGAMTGSSLGPPGIRRRHRGGRRHGAEQLRDGPLRDVGNVVQTGMHVASQLTPQGRMGDTIGLR